MASRRAFTIVEVVVVFAILGLVLGALYQALYVGQVSSKKGISRLDEISKVNRLFEQVKRVLRTVRPIREECPSPTQLLYTLTYTEEVDAPTRNHRITQAKVSGRRVPGQGVEMEFVRGDDRPLTYGFTDATLKIYGSRKLVMIQLALASGERPSVTVASPYFDDAASNIDSPEMSVVDLLAPPAGTETLSASPAAATPGPAPSVAPTAGPFPGPGMVALPQAGTATPSVRPQALPGAAAPPDTRTQTFAGAPNAMTNQSQDPNRSGTVQPGRDPVAAGAGPLLGSAGPVDRVQGFAPPVGAAPPPSAPVAGQSDSTAGTPDPKTVRTGQRPPTGRTGDPPPRIPTAMTPGRVTGGLPPPPEDPMTWTGPQAIDPTVLGGTDQTQTGERPPLSGQPGQLIPPGMYDTPGVISNAGPSGTEPGSDQLHGAGTGSRPTPPGRGDPGSGGGPVAAGPRPGRLTPPNVISRAQPPGGGATVTDRTPSSLVPSPGLLTRPRPPVQAAPPPDAVVSQPETRVQQLLNRRPPRGSQAQAAPPANTVNDPFQ
ncbi:MAG: prepilin-type N-terminal cleavage/methylation domain-containing protein [Candidatus Riflebacteria bacterium]|nr:prepilin-type N-terminal cleavage/methylation domain-containing protein [Candidatus Riflebacteria bacterium]